MLSRCRFAPWALACLLACGCGSKGPARYELSGTVTYNNQPVPAGQITFQPDGAKGNTGPAGQAEIQNGKFQTASGQGTVGGPMKVTILGYDGKPYEENHQKIPTGKPLFAPYTTSIELPKSASTYDFKVPQEKPAGPAGPAAPAKK